MASLVRHLRALEALFLGFREVEGWQLEYFDPIY
jgi:hypothetical protein